MHCDHLGCIVRILIVSNNNTGGAGRAADRLHQSLLAEGENSYLWLNSGNCTTANTFKNGKINKYYRNFLSLVSAKLLNLQSSNNQYPRSLNLFKSKLANKINKSDFDVVNLHWVNGEMLSIRDISRIRKPLVMTLHDMWAFCGAEHYALDGPEGRWRQGYRRSNRAKNETGIDWDWWTWKRKKVLWKKQFSLVCPSAWLADCVRGSALMRDWPVTVIPNPLDLNTYKPWPQGIAREMCGLPAGGKIILFGAIGKDSSGRKGQDLLLESLQHLRESGVGNDCHLAIFGQHKPESEPDLSFPIHWMGHKHDDLSMALLYSSADVMVVPSRLDNLPQTATEAQACGCPVVAFNSGGLADTLEDRVTGYLAKPFDCSDLAVGIWWALDETRMKTYNRELCSDKAKNRWGSKTIVQNYVRLFDSVL